jgi:hypothetical protein
MRKAYQSFVVALGAVIVSACLAACGSSERGSTQSTTTTSTTEAVAAVVTTEDAPPPPDPVSVNVTGPYETTRDQVKLHGTVSPRGSKVRVNGVRAAVSGRHWSKIVSITRKGDNSFKLIGSKPGHDGDRMTALVTRKRSAAEKAAARAAKRQAFIAQATNISYEQLLAHPSRYEGTKAVYRGQIFQVQEDGGATVILLSVTDQGYGFWDDHVWVEFDGTIRGAADDMITVYGTLNGTRDYDTQAGGNTTVPSMRAKYVVE